MAQIKTRRQRVSFTADIAVSPSSQCQNSCKVQTIAFASQVRNCNNNNQRLVNLFDASFFNLTRSVTHFTNLPTGKKIKLHKLRFPRLEQVLCHIQLINPVDMKPKTIKCCRVFLPHVHDMSASYF